MADIKIKGSKIKKALNVKNKVKKAGKAVKSAWTSVVDFMKDVNSVTIGLEKNKHIKAIEFNREGKDYSIKIKGK